jgi:hypothetical protein
MITACTQRMLINVNDPMAFRLALPLVLVVLASPRGKAQDAANDQTQSISLTVPAGVPLRLYLTKRVPKKAKCTRRGETSDSAVRVRP